MGRIATNPGLPLVALGRLMTRISIAIYAPNYPCVKESFTTWVADVEASALWGIFNQANSGLSMAQAPARRGCRRLASKVFHRLLDAW